MLQGFDIEYEISLFKKYIEKNRWILLFCNLMLLLIWLPNITQVNLRIDLETVINKPTTTVGWLDIGRQGALFTKNIFGLRWYNPLLSSFSGMLLICTSGILIGFLFWRMSLNASIVYSIFGILYFTSPIMAEQFYFNLQIFEIALAYILCTVAVGLSYYGILKKKYFLCAIATLFTIWSFSTYQIFVVVFIDITITCYLLLYRRSMNDNNLNYLKIVLGLLIVFFFCVHIKSDNKQCFFLQK